MQWTAVKRPVLERMLGSQFILYGEWHYAKHSVHYRKLPHYFFEFDIYDKDAGKFLDLAKRLRMLDGTGLHTVPVVHRGRVTSDELQSLIGPSAFDTAFENPITGKTDNLTEGLYVRTAAAGYVTGRAKLVRAEFVEKVKQSEHWLIRKLAGRVRPSTHSSARRSRGARCVNSGAASSRARRSPRSCVSTDVRRFCWRRRSRNTKSFRFRGSSTTGCSISSLSPTRAAAMRRS